MTLRTIQSFFGWTEGQDALLWPASSSNLALPQLTRTSNYTTTHTHGTLMLPSSSLTNRSMLDTHTVVHLLATQLLQARMFMLFSPCSSNNSPNTPSKISTLLVNPMLAITFQFSPVRSCLTRNATSTSSPFLSVTVWPMDLHNTNTTDQWLVEMVDGQPFSVPVNVKLWITLFHVAKVWSKTATTARVFGLAFQQAFTATMPWWDLTNELDRCVKPNNPRGTRC